MHLLRSAVILGPPVVGVREDIVNVHDAALQNGSSRRRSSILTDRIPLHDLDEFRRVAIAGRNPINLPIVRVDEALVGVTEWTASFSKLSSTGWSSNAELLITLRTSLVAACCSSASASFISRSALDARRRSTFVVVFVPVERRPGTPVRLFAPLRDKVTSSAQSLVPFGRAQPRIEPANPNRTAR